jgi:hypothetical protein
LAYTTGLNVTTTLRAAQQQAAYKALRHTLIEHSLRQTWRGPESQENLAQDWTDSDPRVARALVEFEDDEDLRLAVVTRAAPKAVTAVLASGEAVQISGVGLRAVQGALAANAAAALRIQRGSVVRVVLQGKSWTLAQWPQAEGALVALDPSSGDVRALVGGFDFYRNQFNHVTQGWRQPGSSYKPFLYSGAIENGVQPDTLINDAPMENVGNWAPENDDGSTDGPITLRSALARSKNLVSIRLMQLLSPKGAREWTSRFGFDPERQPDDLTQALGSGATNPLQMAGAYAVLANGGYRVAPRLITRIARASGEVVFEAAAVAQDETQRAIPVRNAFMVSSLLQEVTRSGTAARAQATLKRADLYGKTGTTNDVFDAWFGGFQPGLVAVVWGVLIRRAAWVHGRRVLLWRFRRGSSSWQPHSRMYQCRNCCRPMAWCRWTVSGAMPSGPRAVLCARSGSMAMRSRQRLRCDPACSWTQWQRMGLLCRSDLCRSGVCWRCHPYPFQVRLRMWLATACNWAPFMRTMNFLDTELMTLTAPDMPNRADCSVMKPRSAILSPRRK